MTGVVEAVSLTLAVLPVVISVTEHFSSVDRALKRYRHFSTELGRLSTLVKVQRTIFHCEIQSLLALCVGWGQAERLLQDTDPAKWDDKVLAESLVTRLGDSRESFLELVEWINAELSEMEDRLTGFEEVAQLAKTGDVQNDRRWRHQIKEKCRFAFSRSQLQESMNTLKDLVQSLGTLRSQAERVEQRRPLSRPSAQARQIVEQFTLVRTASQNLYDALRTACTKHTQHQAQLSLQPIPFRKAQQVRFSAAFKQGVAPGSASKQTAWFTVETTMKPIPSVSSSTESEALALLGQSIKRGRTSSSPRPQRQPSRLRKKHIRFQLPSSPTLQPLPIICTPSEVPLDPPLSNLSSHSNFCNQLQNFLSRPVAQPQCCIGYLEQSSESKHLIYVRGQKPNAAQSTDIPSTSLAELLMQYQAGSDEPFGIAQCERLLLSRKLATAVLQFYATPWLRNSWSSSDVLFQLRSASRTGQIEDLKGPFVDVSVRGSTEAASGGQPTPCYPFAPNDFLFGLGVMLLELAFQKPLRSMQKPCDVANSQDGRHTLFFTAKRMNQTVSAQSGSRYGEIVRKCLACDFGRGDDLTQAALQEGVYSEVVCELAELEDLLKSMSLGP